MGAHEVVESFRWDIAEAGYSVAAITGDRTGCDWAYSVGLHHMFLHPELIVVGLDAPLAGAVVQELAYRVTLGVDLRGRDDVGLGPMPLRFREVDELFCSQGDWFNLGREVLSGWGERWPATLQVVWADADGRFPERNGDPEWLLRQPLLVGA